MMGEVSDVVMLEVVLDVDVVFATSCVPESSRLLMLCLRSQWNRCRRSRWSYYRSRRFLLR